MMVGSPAPQASTMAFDVGHVFSDQARQSRKVPESVVNKRFRAKKGTVLINRKSLVKRVREFR